MNLHVDGGRVGFVLGVWARVVCVDLGMKYSIVEVAVVPVLTHVLCPKSEMLRLTAGKYFFLSEQTFEEKKYLQANQH